MKSLDLGLSKQKSIASNRRSPLRGTLVDYSENARAERKRDPSVSRTVDEASCAVGGGAKVTYTRYPETEKQRSSVSSEQ